MTAEVLTPAVASGRRITFAMRAAHFARGNVLFVVGGCLFLLIVLGAIFAPLIAPYDPTAINFLDKLVRHDHGRGDLDHHSDGQIAVESQAPLFEIFHHVG